MKRYFISISYMFAVVLVVSGTAEITFDKNVQELDMCFGAIR